MAVACADGDNSVQPVVLRAIGLEQAAQSEVADKMIE
jgi:hypothetical protein